MTPRISHAIVLTIISALPLATRAGAVTLPDEFSPEAVREIITEHLDEEVLVRLTTPNDEPVEPAWAETVGLPLIRVLRELWVLSVAIERENDQATRERLRGQYDQRFELLVSGFRDTDDGLWYTTTTYDGTEVTDEAKQTVGQTYVVYVMAEIAHRISDSRARRLAIDTFAQIAQRAHDSEHGGYVERVDRPLDADENAVKQLGTNMHVGLALARLHRIAPTKQTREGLEELLGILTSPRLLQTSGNVPLGFTRDWQPAKVGSKPKQQTLYGHNAELAWYVVEMADSLGRDPRDLLPWLRRVTDAFIKNGVGKDGRVYTFGPWAGPPENRQQVCWWPHTEAMVLLARMHQLTGDERYWDEFEKVARLTFERFVPDDSGAWMSDCNLKTGEALDGSGRPWLGGLHTVRMLLECAEAMGETRLPPVRYAPGRVADKRSVQLGQNWPYWADRSAESIISEVKANGFERIHLVVGGGEIRSPGLVEAAREAGIEVWGTFFPTGIYMPLDLFPPDTDRWLMQFTGKGVGPYRFFSYVHDDYVEWWKQHLHEVYEQYDLDGMVWHEVHYPTHKGITAWGEEVFGDVSPAFQEAFKRATGRSDFPEFEDPTSPRYYETDTVLYEDYLEFRITSVMYFQREVLDGEGGFRRNFPAVPFATWTISISHPDGLAALRENEAQDPARVVAELRPDQHIFQSHAPDWGNQSLGPEYVLAYKPYVDAVKEAQPDLPLGVQGDVGSTLPWRRDPDWWQGFEEAAAEIGIGTTTYYVFALRWEVYYAAPRVFETTTAEGVATVIFDQRIDPTSCEHITGAEIDGNILRFPVADGVNEVDIGGISDWPTNRYPLVGKPEAEKQGPVNVIPDGTMVKLR